MIFTALFTSIKCLGIIEVCIKQLFILQ